ncbi:hypothetical protein T440DRAFT_52494 [Plenodomus tracheiphilus IPT5]|uniref:HTH psq-type domain-containing protein n=1 Tax=Plenodomus tracheiphilus IPT5 TaxID=1408161 RepID=A0A6A7AN38_9PLEO|nr:hypothetical protein T440DRAFT_52494 [Plenodomus tracheiphilus IPT5]
MDPIEAALAAIESLKPGEKLNYTRIAKVYGVERRTLARRHQGITASRNHKAENQQILHP